MQACGNETPSSEAEVQAQPTQIDLLTTKIEANPNEPKLYFQRAMAYNEIDGFDESILDIQNAMRLDSLNPDYYHALADVYFDYYKSREALVTMEQAASFFPTRVETLLKLTEYQMLLKQNGTAIQTAQSILELSPMNPEALFMLGMNLKIMGDTLRAANSFQTAVEQDPELLEGFMQLALLMEAQGKFKLAHQYYNNILTQDSLNTSTLYAKALLYTKQYQDNDAIEIYKKVMKLDKLNPDAPFNIGVIYLEHDSLQQAFDHFHIATRIEPTMAKAYYFKGLSSEKLGDKANALKNYDQVLSFESEYEGKAEDALRRLKQ